MGLHFWPLGGLAVGDKSERSWNAIASGWCSGRGWGGKRADLDNLCDLETTDLCHRSSSIARDGSSASSYLALSCIGGVSWCGVRCGS